MALSIEEEPIDDLAEHGAISIAFKVERILEVSMPDGGLRGLHLTETPVTPAWTKDYDAHDGGPARWASRFDISNWSLLAARRDGVRVGGAVIAWNTPGVHRLEDKTDLAVLWDIRVRPDARSGGIGSALFEAAERWSRAKGCRTLKIETQNVNVPACRFYARMGCELGVVDRHAYAEWPAEVQLLWFKGLG